MHRLDSIQQAKLRNALHYAKTLHDVEDHVPVEVLTALDELAEEKPAPPGTPVSADPFHRGTYTGMAETTIAHCCHTCGALRHQDDPGLGLCGHWNDCDGWWVPMLVEQLDTVWWPRWFALDYKPTYSGPYASWVKWNKQRAPVKQAPLTTDEEVGQLVNDTFPAHVGALFKTGDPAVLYELANLLDKFRPHEQEFDYVWGMLELPDGAPVNDILKALFDKLLCHETAAMHAAVGVSGEAGELLDAVKKTWVYGRELDIANLQEELGDLLFYMQALMIEVGLSFEGVMRANMEKLAKRYPEGYTNEAARERADKKGVE